MQINLTRAAIEKLKDELETLEKTERPRIAERIKHARGYGDLSENYEYHSAKEEQGLLEARIRELRAVLSRAIVVEHDSNNSGQVQLGSRVTVYNKTWDEEIVYNIVTMVDADPTQDKISDQSPIGEALMGGKVGDTVTFQAPAGPQEMEIRKVESAQL
ncbi:MAG: transcription elongation factor GreA [Armatimonadetes bacterium]|nr:transcription elongation factor GreA [Armatimonadota bacterium]